MAVETLTWKGYNYTVKPFTLDTWYGYCEEIAQANDSKRIIRGSFEAACNNLLEGVGNDAKKFLSSGLLAKSVLTSEDHKSALAFKGRVDFLSQAFAKLAMPPTESEEDLTEKQPEKQKPLPRTRKATKGEPAHSG